MACNNHRGGYWSSYHGAFARGVRCACVPAGRGIADSSAAEAISMSKCMLCWRRFFCIGGMVRADSEQTTIYMKQKE